MYNGKYFGSLAKAVNLWSSCGNPKKIRESLRQCHHDHRDRATDTRAQKLPQRPLKGRWSAVSNSEKYLRAFTQDEFVHVWERKIGPSRGLVEHDSVECCFQPAGFLHLKEIQHKGACLHTCPEEQSKLTRFFPQYTTRTTRRRSSEQTRTVCTDRKQTVWRPMLWILATFGQNAFRGGIVNQWYHSEMSTIGGTAWRNSKMPKFVCWKSKQFMEEFARWVWGL